MKKIYASTVLTLLVGSVAFGQYAKHDASHQRQVFKNNYSENSRVTTVENSLRGGGSPLWSDNFDSTSVWTIDNEVGNNDNWVIGPNGPSGQFAIAALASTSGGNFALFDSDLLCSGNQLANLTTAMPITALGSTGGVILEFEQNYRKYIDSTYIYVSNDGTNWDRYPVNVGFENNDGVDSNPDLVQVNITPTAGNQPNVWIRFQFYSPSTFTPAGGSGPGCAYAWMVDDIAIYPAPDNDMVTLTSWHGDPFLDWEYKMIPMGQAHDVTIGAAITNNGGVAQSNVVVNWDISRDGNSVASGTESSMESFAVGARDTVWVSTGYVPDALGEYEVSVSVAADSTDANPDDNGNMTSFEMTEYVWSHETEAMWDGQYGGYVEDNQATPLVYLEYAHGIVYQAVADGDLTAIQVSFGNLTSGTHAEPISIFYEVHEQGSGAQDIISSEVEIKDLRSDGWFTLAFPDPVFMTAGTAYTLAVRSSGDPDVMTINGVGIDEDFACTNYGPFGEGEAVNWYVGWGHTPAIRANFHPDAVGLTDPSLSSLNVSPNPAHEALNVAFRLNESGNFNISVVSVDGKQVYSESAGYQAGMNKETIDVSDLPNGMYVVSITTEHTVHTERIVISH